MRKEAREKLKLDNPSWMADMRRLEAIDHDATQTVMEEWVERGKVVDESSAGSSEAKVWLLDHPDTFKWAIDQKLLTDDGSDWNEQVLRLNVDMAKLDEDSEEFANLERKKEGFSDDFTRIDDYVAYYSLSAAGFRQERYLAEHKEFAAEMKTLKGIEPPDYIPPVEYDEIQEKAERTPEEEQKIKGWDKKVPLKYSEAVGSPIDDYVGYYSLLVEGTPDDWPSSDSWYEDDWWLQEHIDFYKEVYLGVLGNGRKDYRKTPSREVWQLYLVYLSKREGTERLNYRIDNLDLDDWLVLAKGLTPVGTRTKKEVGELTEEEKRRLGIGETREDIERRLKALK